MARRDVSPQTKEGRERLKEVRKEQREAKIREREALEEMLGKISHGGRTRRSKKRSTFMPGHHGNK